MKIQIDSREQKYSHITNYFDEVGIEHFRQKLDVGDYMNVENPLLVIDRKKDLQEVAGNVCQQHARFIREIERANNQNIQLIFLVEEPNIKQLVDVCGWYNWRKRTNPKAINGKTLYKIMKTIQDKYGVEWQFTPKGLCGKRISEILGGEL